MIARTESSRVVNTATLQTYVNEGYAEVNILTAGDEKVCIICAELEANNPHTIQELIETGMFVPVHPNCRCTYTAVLESYHPDNMNNNIVIDLTPSNNGLIEAVQSI